MRNRLLLVSVLGLGALPCAAQTGIPTSYTVQAVPSFELTNLCTGLDDQGQAVGWSNDFYHFFGGYFPWISGPDGVGAQELYPFNGMAAALATAVNDQGVVAGGVGGENFGGIGIPNTSPVVWTPASIGHTLTTIPASGTSVTAAINDAGQVAGTETVAGTSTRHAFLYDPGLGVTDLGSLAGPAGSSAAVAVNATGQVAGTTDTPRQAGAAFVTGPGGQGMRRIQAPDGKRFACVAGLNDRGQVAGCVIDAAGVQHAALTGPDGRHVHDLGVLNAGDQSQAVAVNASGATLGVSFRPTASTLFVTGPNGHPMSALAPLVPLPAGQALSSVVAINARGQICANVRTQTEYQQLVVVLTPVWGAVR